MNTEHKDINKVLPFGEQLRGFANQRFLTQAELNRILKERGIFSLNEEKEYTVSMLQTLLLSPEEFDKIRESFSTREDNKKKISRDIKWNTEQNVFDPTIAQTNVKEFMERNLPTCSLAKPVVFAPVNGNKNHIRAEIEITRNDLNKSWYEQTNLFELEIEFINDDSQGNGRVIITHTAPETKELAEHIVAEKIKQFKEKGSIQSKEILKKIVFKDFSNSERFVFFFRLTNHIENEFFNCTNIKDVSMKPEASALPEEIQWMQDLNKIILSGKSLGKKDFIKDNKFHPHLIIWNIEAEFGYDYRGQKGSFTANFGFPDYTSKKAINSEFELNISSIRSTKSIDARTKNSLKSQLLSEMDKQKSNIYNKFLEFKNNPLKKDK